MLSTGIAVIIPQLAKASQIIASLTQAQVAPEHIYLIIKNTDLNIEFDRPQNTDAIGILIREKPLNTLGLLAGLPTLRLNDEILMASLAPIPSSLLNTGLSSWLAELFQPSFSHAKIVKEYSQAVTDGMSLVIAHIPFENLEPIIQSLQAIDTNLHIEKL